ncbi:hypothetical protein QTP88_002508 [Uroleucon formosanum]
MTSHCQPLDQGITQQFKKLYRKQLFQKAVADLDAGESSAINVLDAVYWVASAQAQIKPETVKKCFLRCGFSYQVDEQLGQTIDTGEQSVIDRELLALITLIDSSVEVETYFELDKIISTHDTNNLTGTDDPDEPDESENEEEDKPEEAETSKYQITSLQDALSAVKSVDHFISSIEVHVFTYAFYIFGIFGNLLSLFILYRARSSANKKYVFMLHCLLTNDFFLLVSHLVLTFVHNTWVNNNTNLWMCRSCVLFQFFVWGTVCSAIMMAADRWLAFTKSFFYQKVSSFRLMKRMIVILWFEVLCLVCAPFFGFGLYWDETQCKDFEDAEKPLDVLYVYLYLGHGVILTIAMVYTNLAVIIALCVKDSHIRNNYNELIRHVKRQGSSMTRSWLTEEERSFGWFVLLVCVEFVTLWVPQMAIFLSYSRSARAQLISRQVVDFLYI